MQSRQHDENVSHPGFMSPQAPTKPFAGTQPFSSGVSPYMNLFRNDTNGGTIDNYSTLVRPALNQQSMNQQFNLDISYGAERYNRLQNWALRQTDRGGSGRVPQSVGTPQFFMNYGPYYPGAGQGSGQGGGYGP
jgi:hypothetical protein